MPPLLKHTFFLNLLPTKSCAKCARFDVKGFMASLRFHTSNRAVINHLPTQVYVLWLALRRAGHLTRRWRSFVEIDFTLGSGFAGLGEIRLKRRSASGGLICLRTTLASRAV